MDREDIDESVTYPEWWGNKKFHDSHKSNLLKKDFDFYSQYRWSFATEVPKDEIFEYITGLIHVDSEILILTEVSDKVSVHVPFEKSGHLFDLDNPGQNNDYSIDMKGVIENTDLYDDLDEDDIDISFSNEVKFSKDFESQFKSKVSQWMGTPATKTTLDTILDKINVLGMDSLTKHELTLLQNYSNN
jgi:hypothetical protein